MNSICQIYTIYIVPIQIACTLYEVVQFCNESESSQVLEFTLLLHVRMKSISYTYVFIGIPKQIVALKKLPCLAMAT